MPESRKFLIKAAGPQNIFKRSFFGLKHDYQLEEEDNKDLMDKRVINYLLTDSGSLKIISLAADLSKAREEDGSKKISEDAWAEIRNK